MEQKIGKKTRNCPLLWPVSPVVAGLRPSHTTDRRSPIRRGDLRSFVSAGSGDPRRTSSAMGAAYGFPRPGGTIERKNFSRPSGTFGFACLLPSDKSLGYSQMPLRGRVWSRTGRFEKRWQATALQKPTLTYKRVNSLTSCVWGLVSLSPPYFCTYNRKSPKNLRLIRCKLYLSRKSIGDSSRGAISCTSVVIAFFAGFAPCYRNLIGVFGSRRFALAPT